MRYKYKASWYFSRHPAVGLYFILMHTRSFDCYAWYGFKVLWFRLVNVIHAEVPQSLGLFGLHTRIGFNHLLTWTHLWQIEWVRGWVDKWMRWVEGGFPSSLSIRLDLYYCWLCSTSNATIENKMMSWHSSYFWKWKASLVTIINITAIFIIIFIVVVVVVVVVVVDHDQA